MLLNKLRKDHPQFSYFNIDGDDLRDLFQNKDYLKVKDIKRSFFKQDYKINRRM